MSDWRTLQMFLSPRQPAIYEVDMDLDSQDTRCNCPTYKGRRVCRHVKFVKARMESNGGNYPLMVHEHAEKEDISQVMSDPDRFREFIVRYGRVEVL